MNCDQGVWKSAVHDFVLQHELLRRESRKPRVILYKQNAHGRSTPLTQSVLSREQLQLAASAGESFPLILRRPTPVLFFEFSARRDE